MSAAIAPAISLQDYLRAHFVSKENPKPITNTRIGDKTQNIYGGSYHIPDDEYETFLQIYYRDVIERGNPEFLTEKQRTDDGPIAIDLDFRYTYDVESRQHTDEHIIDFIAAYLEELKKVFQFAEKTRMDVFVFEKPDVNRVEADKITKDGIHLIFALQADRATQLYLRERMLEFLPEIWGELPLTNTWDKVVDDGIVAGCTNWQLFGSKKPNNQAYDLVMCKSYQYSASDGEFDICADKINIKNKRALMPRLSIRYAQHPKLHFTADFTGKHAELVGAAGAGSSTAGVRRAARGGGGGAAASISTGNAIYLSIRTAAELEDAVENFLDLLTVNDVEIREAHLYTMILPESYYGKDSYNKWIRVGWALRNISDRLFLTWFAFSAKSPQFRFGGAAGDVADLWERWQKFDLGNPDGLTKRSIMYWAKQDAKQEFEKVRTNSIDYFVDESLNAAFQSKFADDKVGSCVDFDLARVLYQMYKDEYVCVSVKGNLWYRYKNHRWQEIDSGTYLRKSISEDMRKLYEHRSTDLMKQIAAIPTDGNEEQKKRLKERFKMVLGIVARLGSSCDKKNIMTEARDLFYDSEFFQKLDINPYLLCFNNGVVDFQQKIFRKGYPDDYISKTTNIDYWPLDRTAHATTIAEITDFMDKLFPVRELRDYMWAHLSSVLIGTSANQTFNMYLGAGQNGKSVLVNLMESILGQYKGDVPLTLITQQRAKVGGLTPELVALKGVRYAVMQEPSKGDKINEGIMKQITSGIDPIQCRAPYMTTVLTYIPQFKLVVCTNQLMEIKSNDHGTWRRIRVCDFVSLFTDNPVQDDAEKPYQYKIDKAIIEKFKYWKEVFMSMLVEKAFQTGGIVEDCSIVMASSNNYRTSQDYIVEFITERIIKREGGKLRKQELSEEFRVWYMNTYNKNVPSVKEVCEYINKHMSKYDKVKQLWHNLSVNYPDRGEEEDDSSAAHEEDGATEQDIDEDYGL